MKFVHFASLMTSIFMLSALGFGCNEPSSPNDLPSEINPGGDNMNPGGDNTNPGGDNTNPGGDNTNPGGDNSNPGGDNSNPETENPPVQADTVTTEACDQYTLETCDGNIARFCNEDGKITLRDCSKLSTVEKPLVCKKLSEDNFVDCVAPCNKTNYVPYNTCSGRYVEMRACYDVEGGGSYEFGFTNDACPKYCNNGVCVDTPAPEVGAACSSSSAPTCYNGDGYDCINNVIVKKACSGESTCAMQPGDTQTQCVEKCHGREDTYACTTQNGMPALDNYVCRMALDAKFYLFHETTTCETSCDAGVCDIQVPRIGDSCNPDQFNDVCARNALYYCHMDTKKVVSVVCGAGDYIGQQLCRDITETYSDCVSPCTEGTEPLMQCVKGKEFSYTDNLVCRQALDGAYYNVNEQEKCTGECKNGVCL